MTEDGFYVSTADFSSTTAGTFEVGFEVLMRAGKSHVTWVDGEKATITVTAPVVKEHGSNGVGNGGKINPSGNGKGENSSTKGGK